MKIVLSTDKLTRGGKEKQLLLLSSGLLDRGHDVHIVSKNDVDPTNFFEEIGFPSDRIHSFGKEPKFGMRKRFIRKVVDIAPEVILNFDISTSLWTEQLSSPLKRIPTINCTIRRATPYTSAKSNLLAKLCLRRSKYIVALSEAGLKLYGIPKSKDNVVIHCGINIEKYKHATPLSFKEIFGVEKPNGTFIVANVANLFEHKGQQTLIEAIGKLVDKRVFAFILGEGPLRSSLQLQINRLNLSDRVKLVGRQSNVAEYLKCADVYVNTSWGEGFSNGLLEAMASNLPIITTPDGGISEVVDPNNTVYFEKNNSHELQNILTSTMKNETLGSASDERINQFDVSKMVDKFETFIKRAVAN